MVVLLRYRCPGNYYRTEHILGYVTVIKTNQWKSYMCFLPLERDFTRSAHVHTWNKISIRFDFIDIVKKLWKIWKLIYHVETKLKKWEGGTEFTKVFFCNGVEFLLIRHVFRLKYNKVNSNFLLLEHVKSFLRRCHQSCFNDFLRFSCESY